MNLAFQALIIVALVLPGIILRHTYRNGFFWYRPRHTIPITEEVAYSLVLACGLHFLYAPVVARWWPIDLKSVAVLLLGQYGKDSELLPSALTSLVSSSSRIFLYFVGLYAFSAAIGFGSHWVVRKLKLDLKTRLFRFTHHWHYLLTGEMGQFPDSQLTVPEDFDLVALACVVDISAGSFLYVGVLDSFYFNKTGELELLVLTGAMRRPIKPAEDSPKDPYYFIDAEYLYLKYGDIKNISIKYIQLPPEVVAYSRPGWPPEVRDVHD